MADFVAGFRHPAARLLIGKPLQSPLVSGEDFAIDIRSKDVAELR